MASAIARMIVNRRGFAMKIVMFIGAAAIVGVGVYIKNPIGDPNVYNMPVDAAYSKLAHSAIQPSGTGAFGRLDTATVGNGSNKVTWSARGSHASLEPAETSKTRVTVECEGGGAGDGAAAGMVLNMRISAAIEMVDSILKDRPYDPERARGATAARWPRQEVKNGNIFAAGAEAQRMNAETQSSLREMESRNVPQQSEVPSPESYAAPSN
jgi:hypothetical protein